jgi:ssDNA-binding replication factor A large subunit
MTAEDQARRMGEAWDRAPHPRELATRLVVDETGGVRTFSLGAHAPALTMDDIARIHRLWIEAIRTVGPEVHHRDIVTAALGSFEDELVGPQHERALARLGHAESRT